MRASRRAHRRILLASEYGELGIGVAAGAPNKDAAGATYTLVVGAAWDGVT